MQGLTWKAQDARRAASLAAAAAATNNGVTRSKAGCLARI